MPGGRAIVAIDGVDGSGKSMLAAVLAAALDADGVPAIVLRVDDFRRPLDWARADKTQAELYYEDYYDLPALDRCLREFLAGASTATVPHYDAAAERLAGTRTLVFGPAGRDSDPPGDADLDPALAIVEGVFVLRVATVAADAALIYVQVSAEEAQRRVLARDVARGRTEAEVSRRLAARYAPGQVRYHQEQDPVARAAAVIDNQDAGAPRVARLDAGRLPPPVTRALRRLAGEGPRADS